MSTANEVDDEMRAYRARMRRYLGNVRVMVITPLVRECLVKSRFVGAGDGILDVSTAALPPPCDNPDSPGADPAPAPKIDSCDSNPSES